MGGGERAGVKVGGIEGLPGGSVQGVQVLGYGVVYCRAGDAEEVFVVGGEVLAGPHQRMCGGEGWGPLSVFEPERTSKGGLIEAKLRRKCRLCGWS